MGSSAPFVALALLAPSLALAADRGTAERLRELEVESGRIGSEIEDTRLNFTERSGLIGIGEARRRYEDAVYAYLVGDFESGATDFYILVQSRALGNAALARDAEWYLAECLFELGNLRTAEESYRVIVEKGPSHPYFADAVRRNLEVYGLLGDDAGFTTYYNTWIVTGKVPATDLVNYTLGKAFVRRNELPRAKALFEGLGPQSPFYTRARYQMGVLMIKEGNLPAAAAEFRKIEGAPVTDDEQKRIQGLAILALGRLMYEQGEFSQASGYYERVEKNSPEFADKLYEAVWSFVKQATLAEEALTPRSGTQSSGNQGPDAQSAGGAAGLTEEAREAKKSEADARWRDAVSQVDIFLLAYPEHRYTAQLKLLQGHLHMKLREYDEARKSYEEVIEAYGPVAERLDDISFDQASAARFLDRIGDTGGTSGLPPYALEMLLGRDDISRATRAYLDVRELRAQVTRSQRDVADLETALSGDSDSLGMFVAARNQLTTMRGAGLAMRARLLQAEIGYLRGRTSGATKAELSGLQKELEALGEGSQLASEVGSTTDKLQIYEAQVREVQQRAFRIQQVAEEAVVSGKSIAEVLSRGSKLSPTDQERVRADLAAARGELDSAIAELQSAQSEITRRKIMRAVEAGSVQENQGERARTLARFATLHDSVTTYRRNAQDTDSAAIYAQIDRLWGQLDALESSSSDAARVVATGEAKETQAVRQRLAATAQKVTELQRELDSGGVETEALAAKVALHGLRAVKGQFESAIVDAEKGIVDVYWIRKSETSDEEDALIAQQAKLLQDLNDRFRLIRENLDR